MRARLLASALLAIGLSLDSMAAVVVGASTHVNDGSCSTGSTGVPECSPSESAVGAFRSASVDYAPEFGQGDAHANVTAYQGGTSLYAFTFGFADPPFIKGSARAINNFELTRSSSGASFSGLVTDSWLLGGAVPSAPGKIVWRLKLTGDVVPGPGAGYCIDVRLSELTDSASYCAGSGAGSTHSLVPTLSELDLATFALVGTFDDLSTLVTPETNHSLLGLTGFVRADTGEGERSLDLGSTFILELVEVLDVDGNPIPGVTFNFGSGAVVPLRGAAVVEPGTGIPEPSGLGLLALGAAGLACRARRATGARARMAAAARE